MPINAKYIASFEPNCFYHIIIKSAGNTPIFLSDNNRIFFLKKFKEYTQGYFDTYAYILLNNHVHFLVKASADTILQTHISQLQEPFRKQHQKKFLSGTISFEQALEFQMKDFLISYAKAYNKQSNRTGALFMSPFRRVAVADDAHFTQLIIYIHANIVKHNVDRNFEKYNWSSYQSIISERPTSIKRNEVLEWFGSKTEFIKIHRENTEHFYHHILSME